MLTADGATGLDPLSGRPCRARRHRRARRATRVGGSGATSPEDTLEAHPAGKSGLITPEAQEVPEMTTIATTTRTREERPAPIASGAPVREAAPAEAARGTWQSTLVPADSARAI